MHENAAGSNEAGASSTRGAKVVCFKQTHAIGYFALLTECVLLSKACEQKGVEPYFFVSHATNTRRGLSPNSLSYYFDQVNLSQAVRGECQRSVLRGDCVEIRDRYDINRFARGNPYKEIANDLTTIDEGRRLFLRNLKIKAWIEQCANKFWRSRFHTQRVVGVHYRGKDKFGTESQAIGSRSVLAAMNDAIATGIDAFFVATDDPQFALEARQAFGDRCVSFSIPRPGLAHYEDTANNFRKGAEAIIDSLLLSRCERLIKTPSLLSAWCKVFNPGLEVQTIGKPFFNAYGEVELTGFGYWPEKCLHEGSYVPRYPTFRRLVAAWPDFRKLRKLYALAESLGSSRSAG